MRLRGLIVLIHKIGKTEKSCCPVVEGKEAVFGVQNFLQGLMDDLQQFVEIGGANDPLNDFKEHIHLVFRSFALGDVDEHTDDTRCIPKINFLP